LIAQRLGNYLFGIVFSPFLRFRSQSFGETCFFLGLFGISFCLNRSILSLLRFKFLLLDLIFIVRYTNLLWYHFGRLAIRRSYHLPARVVVVGQNFDSDIIAFGL